MFSPAAVAAEVSSCDNSLSYSSLLLTTIFILFLTLQVLSASAFVITVHVMILMFREPFATLRLT